MNRVPVALQSMRNECGLACLAMVVGFYDRHTSLTELRRRFAGYSQGLTLKHLADFAAQLNFLTRGLRAEPCDLKQVRLPAILHWNMDHFVVLVRVGRKGCVIHDPARGRVLCPWAEIGERFTGVVLELWPGQKFKPAAAADANLKLRHLWGLLSGSKHQVGWIALLTLAVQIMVLAAPWHVQWTVDEALMTGDAHLIGVLCVGFALLLACRLLTHLLRGFLVLHLGHMLSFQLACGLLRHLLRLPLGWFEQRHLGDITSRFASLQPLREWLTQGAAAAVVDLLMVLLSLLLMLVYSPLPAFGVFILHAGFVAVHMGFVPRLKGLSMGVVVAQAAEQSHLLESARAVHNLKLYTLEERRLEQWQRLHAQTLTRSLSLQRTQLGLGTSALLVGGIELIGLVYFMAHQVLAGAFTLGMMFAFLSYRGHFTERLHSFADQLASLRTLQVHLARVGEIWTEPVEAERSLSQIPFQCSGVAPIALRDAGFRHNAAQPWLFRDLSLEIAPGEFVALVGASGCGKTTLLKLLMGLLPPQEGMVVWGERPLTGSVAIELRRHSGCVLQTDSFFSGSILDNIALFEVPDMDRLQQCLSIVGMNDTLARMPTGYHTQLGDIGHSLSSGQMQRLLLARALYRDPDYLFLDEGTANLDVSSAQMIHDLVGQLPCTRVVITHDLQFAAGADRVLALEQGQLREVKLLARTAAVPSAG